MDYSPLITPVTSQNSSARHYGAVEEGHYVQLTRKSSLLSDRMHSLHLAPAGADSSGYVPETETSMHLEVSMIMKSSLPLIATFVLQYSLTVASVYAVGNLGSAELAAVSLSNLLASISSYGIIQGIASALSTLCPQAYGRKDYAAVGLQTLRCACLLAILYIPIFALWYWGSYPLFKLLVPEQEVALLASKYLRRLVVGVFGFAIFEVTKQYLQAQGIFHASTYVLLICAPLNVFLNIELVWNETFGMGFIGAPTAVAITNWLMAALLVLYTIFIDGYQCWPGFTWEIFKHWGRLLSLAGPGVLMIEAEWLAFEIIAVASSRFGTAALAAQSIVATTCVSLYQIPYAISVAAATRVAWYIGSACHNAAVVATRASLCVAVVFGFINFFTLLTFRYKLASVFSQDPDVVALAAKVLIIGAAYQIADCISCVCGGILRGQGRQYIGGWLNLISYYIVALPIAYLCGFTLNLGLMGLWLGMLAALITVCFGSTTAVLTSDWDSLISKSIEDGINDMEQLSSNSTQLALSPAKSVASLVDHNMLSPMASISTSQLLA